MSKRVHEIAKELELNNKEVIGRLNEAGVEVSHHSASVEDSVFEKVFGNGQPVRDTERPHRSPGSRGPGSP